MRVVADWLGRLRGVLFAIYTFAWDARERVLDSRCEGCACAEEERMAGQWDGCAHGC